VWEGRGAGIAAGCAGERPAKASDATIKVGTEAVKCIVGFGIVADAKVFFFGVQRQLDCCSISGTEIDEQCSPYMLQNSIFD
jgi:hypothetical protein